MSEFKAISINKLIIFSLISLILTIFVFSQVIAAPQTDPQTALGPEDNIEITPPDNGNPGASPVQDVGDFKANVESAETVSKVDTLKYYFMVSISSIAVSAILMIGLAFAFVFYLNAAEISEFVNQAFQINDLDGKIGNYGKSHEFRKYGGTSIASMKLHGFRKLQVQFTLPIADSLDPKEFGLIDELTHASTNCDLELLPLKLRVISEYFRELEN